MLSRGFSKTSRLALPEYAALVLAAIIAYAYYVAWLDVPILHDAAGYLRAGQDIAKNGLFSKWELSDLRTYAWPLLLSGLLKLAHLTGISLRLLVFLFNLLLFLASCLVCRRALQLAGATPRLARLAFLAIVLNPFVLIYPGYLLTESLSFSLIILLLAACVLMVSPFGRDRLMPLVAAGSLLLGLAIMTRPGNLAMLPVWAGAMLIGFVIHRPGLARLAAALALTLVCFALPLTPQLLNNARHYGQITPLTISTITKNGYLWEGVKRIKYATSHTGNNDPQVFYESPLYGNEPLSGEHPLTWYREHPLKGAATVGLHLFNLLDQDLPFPYNTNLVPAYYPAVATANMFVVACGFIGLMLAGRLAFRDKRRVLPSYLLAVVMLVFQFAMLMFFSVETRWGVPSLIVLYVFAVFLIGQWLPSARPRERLAVLLIASMVTAAAYPVSHWVRRQAPQIQAAMQRQRDMALVPGVIASIVPGRLFASGDLGNWALSVGGVGHDSEAILFARRPGEFSALVHPVALEKDTVYQVEFDAQAVAAVTAELSVDLYAGGACDRREQNSLFTAFEKTYTHFKARWNSGPDAPRDATLRFVTLSTNPIQIKNIVFRKIQ